MDDSPREPSPLLTLIVFALLLLGIAGAVILLLASQPRPAQIMIVPPAPTATPAPTAVPEPITVYVTGAVAQPEQLIRLPFGSRVEDALTAVGGVRADADIERVNRAAILRDGDQVHVPVRGGEIALPTASGGELVRINSATAEEIDALPGIGPALAARIVEYRSANGPFASLDALDAVSGIGPALLAELEGRLVFD